MGDGWGWGVGIPVMTFLTRSCFEQECDRRYFENASVRPPPTSPLSTQYGTYKTVKARFWPSLSGESHSNLFKLSHVCSEADRNTNVRGQFEGFDWRLARESCLKSGSSEIETVKF